MNLRAFILRGQPVTSSKILAALALAFLWNQPMAAFGQDPIANRAAKILEESEWRSLFNGENLQGW